MSFRPYTHRPKLQRAAAILLVIASAVLAAPAIASAGPACYGPLPTDAGSYNAATWNRADGWLGADATSQVDLGDGRILWLMGDTDWGSRAPEGPYRPGWTMRTNSAFVQTGDCFTSARPHHNFVEPSPGADLYWPTDGYVVGEDLYVVFARIKVTGGTFGFRSDGHDLVRLDKTTFRFEGRWPLPDRSRDWGSSVERHGHTIYWWGRAPTGAPGNSGHMFLARSTLHRMLDFEYRTSDGWSTNAHAAIPVHRRPRDSNVSFAQLPDGRWAASYKDQVFGGRHVELDVAANPWGPWAHMGRIGNDHATRTVLPYANAVTSQ